ncbi:MAG: hypothetical protein ACREK5_05235 [Gemmatimonadota bacterium]
MRHLRITLLGLVTAALAACTGDDGPTAPADDSLVPRGGLGLAAAVQAHQQDLMSLPGVVGVGQGETAAGRPAVVVLARDGGVRGVPAAYGAVPVRVIVTGEIYALPQGPPCPPKCGGGGGGGNVDPTARFDRPVPIGVSTGHPDITAGTIGARVRRGTTVYALSNNHVYADANQASIGDDVIQPGTFDGGSAPADKIGDLAQFEPIVFSTSANNRIDAAIATTTTSLLGNATPSNGYGTPRTTTATVNVNDRVMKYGRTTGQTKGRVLAINTTVNVGYGSPGTARFVDQIVIGGGGFSQGGDSGSLIVLERGSGARRPIGLLFAGSSSVTIANPIDFVLDAFNVTVDGE